MKAAVQRDHPNFDKQYPSCGVQADKFIGDPRINDKQMNAIIDATKHDHEAIVLGMDENSLPVVRARVGQPPTSRKWAIKRNGDPVTAGAIFEVWGAPQQGATAA